MNFGENCEPIREPSCLKNPPGVKIAPAASETPRTFLTSGSSFAGIVGVTPLSCLTGSRAVITTSVPFSDSLKI